MSDEYIKTKTILIVDDVAPDRMLLEKTVTRKVGAMALAASSGEEALEVILSKKIDLVLLDVNMPQMSGDELVTKIRQDSSLTELPIIMVSGNHQNSIVTK